MAKLKIRSWAGKIVDREVTKEIAKSHGLTRDAGVYYKHLLPHGAMSRIKTVMSAVQNYHYEHTVPWTDAGERLLPIEFHEKYDAQMAEFQEHLVHAKLEFIKDYPKNLESAKIRLGRLFKKADYSSAEEIMDKVSFMVAVLPVPEAKHLVAEMADEALERTRKSVESGGLRSHLGRDGDALWAACRGRQEGRQERLDVDEDGQPLTFRDSLIENVRSTVSVARTLNLLNDPKLSEMLNQVDLVLDGVTPNNLRPNHKDAKPGAREKVRDGLAEVMAGYMGDGSA